MTGNFLALSAVDLQHAPWKLAAKYYIRVGTKIRVMLLYGFSKQWMFPWRPRNLFWKAVFHGISCNSGADIIDYGKEVSLAKVLTYQSIHFE